MAAAVAPAMGVERWGFLVGAGAGVGLAVAWWQCVAVAVAKGFYGFHRDFSSAAENAEFFLLGATSWADPCGFKGFCKKHVSHRSMRKQQNKMGVSSHG